MKLRSFFIRNRQLNSLLELFLVASVSSVLVIRFALAVSGYPQLGGRELHIAHLLWGGLLMLVALVLLLTFLGRRIQVLAALLGGIGFGTFVDELGKFITRDNNYFFQPTVALIYSIFIVLLFSFRGLGRRLYASSEEYVANALELLEEALLHEMDEQEKVKILLLLRASNSPDVRLQLLAEAVERMPAVPRPKIGRLTRMARGSRRFVQHLVSSPRFAPLLILFFIGYALLSTLFLLFGVLNVMGLVARHMTLGFVQMALLASGTVTDLLLLIGVLLLHRSPLRAYHWFKGAILVSILFTQVFMFYLQQLGALDELAVNLLLLAGLDTITRHTHHAHQQNKMEQAPASERGSQT
jgi:hypothetical protein